MHKPVEAARYFKHETALVESHSIGEGTRIWAFAHVLPGAVIGANCNICDNTFIENDVEIGDRVTIKCGVQLWDGVTLEDDVFVGPNVTFTNDRMPRSRQRPEAFARTTVCAGASIGANATILPGVTIGRSAMVGAGTPMSSALTDVHLPVPFCPAVSRTTSTKGFFVTGSFCFRMSAVISMRKLPSMPEFHSVKIAPISAGLSPSRPFIRA